MAYNLCQKFPSSSKYYKLLDPGAYQKDEGLKLKLNNVPFLVKSPRNTQPGLRLWTHAIYNADFKQKILNCTSINSKIPRFPYEAFTKEDLEDILCQCGTQNVCECISEDDDEKEEIICQAKVPRCLFKGSPPRSVLGEDGLSAPSKRDDRFDILSNGFQQRKRNEFTDENPPFYDARINESTAFYHGCKWSKWTSKRSTISFITEPGPADYNLEQESNKENICAEKVRAYRRKTSKQLRFIEMLQQRNISEGLPGPATYTPISSKCIKSNFFGYKTERFPIPKLGDFPGPANYSIKRTFELPEWPIKPCHAKLPKRACFGNKAQRFKTQREKGPSPASYYVSSNKCHIMHCAKVPFGSTSVRFKEKLEEESENEIVTEEQSEKKENEVIKKYCHNLTWQFKSKTLRMKPQSKNLKDPSPADFSQPRVKVGRLRQFQYTAPFFTSEGRFQPWYDWMPIFGRLGTPGPCTYNLERPKCLPAVHHGPLYRASRFPPSKTLTPAPNEYKVGGGIETILTTYNQRLKNNINNQHKFHWESPTDPKTLNYEEQEMMLLNKSIALLNNIGLDNVNETPSSYKSSSPRSVDMIKPKKILRCFLYSKQNV